MTSFVVSILLKFANVDTICQILAKGIAAVLNWASKRGGTAWDISKKVITQVNGWCNLYLEVYDDDTMTQEEEAKVAEAIKNRTDIAKIVDIIKAEKKAAGEDKGAEAK